MQLAEEQFDIQLLVHVDLYYIQFNAARVRRPYWRPRLMETSDIEITRHGFHCCVYIRSTVKNCVTVCILEPRTRGGCVVQQRLESDRLCCCIHEYIRITEPWAEHRVTESTKGVQRVETVACDIERRRSETNRICLAEFNPSTGECVAGQQSVPVPVRNHRTQFILRHVLLLPHAEWGRWECIWDLL